MLLCDEKGAARWRMPVECARDSASIFAATSLCPICALNSFRGVVGVAG